MVSNNFFIKKKVYISDLFPKEKFKEKIIINDIKSLGKAGKSRWIGRRPHVRGVAMNPVDHPHGGGEGRTSGGRCPVSPTGVKDGKRTVRGGSHRSKPWVVRSRHKRKERRS